MACQNCLSKGFDVNSNKLNHANMRGITEADRERVKNQFFTRGESVVSWAEQHGFACTSVYQVLNGHSRASRGKSHRIAVALGLKPGPEASPETLQTNPAKENPM